MQRIKPEARPCYNKMSNTVIGIDKSKSFRVYLTVSSEMAETARCIHDTTPLATAALGRVLTGAGLMGIMLKNESDKLTVHFKGNGPAQQILATADGNGNVKGYVSNPDIMLPLTEKGKLDVGGAIGVGNLTVIKDLGLKDPYVGSIALVSGEIADDLTAYYFISEQQNTSVALGVKIDRDCSVLCAGGMIIQMLPDAEEGAISALEELIKDLPPMTTLIENEMQNKNTGSPQNLADMVLENIFRSMPENYAVEKLENRDIRWNCDCSRERIEKALITIGKKDLREIIDEDGKAELTCQFCTKKYGFDKEQLEQLYARI